MATLFVCSPTDRLVVVKPTLCKVQCTRDLSIMIYACYYWDECLCVRGYLGKLYGDDRGIVPRSLELLGEYKKQKAKTGWKFLFQVTFVEIYMEQVLCMISYSF